MQAYEGRLEPSGSTMIGPVIVNEGKIMRPSQLIAGATSPLQPLAGYHK